MSLDLTSEFGSRADRRMREETVIWLTTVDAVGTPQPIPVWFLWDGTTFLIYSQPDTAKLRNLRRSPRLALNLESDPDGNDIVVVLGRGEILEGPRADEVPDYVDKYAGLITRIGYDDPAGFARSYSVPIRVTPDHWRGF